MSRVAFEGGLCGRGTPFVCPSPVRRLGFPARRFRSLGLPARRGLGARGGGIGRAVSLLQAPGSAIWTSIQVTGCDCKGFSWRASAFRSATHYAGRGCDDGKILRGSQKRANRGCALLVTLAPEKAGKRPCAFRKASPWKPGGAFPRLVKKIPSSPAFLLTLEQESTYAASSSTGVGASDHKMEANPACNSF
jgi:hypothetical protein